ncbi:nucleoporin Nup43-like isoform X2 [Biomphalaria glabrata]|uniref:Nucleoporin Nup43-like isoform X2 n=1 Tax=Biomphalaria glabrata TaxID=6526 RepID=A0A9W3AJV5_BIOGL|nr:nucleoporin Nup43-like isoform X2 [Biomphalaria glabrata]
MTDISVKFVSKKISKIRWRPKSDVKSAPSTIFVTGSWDDQQNTICVWDLRDRIAASDDRDDEISALDHEPQKTFEMPYAGDVLDLQYLSSNTFAVASSTGAVTVLKHLSSSETLAHLCTWDKHHQFKTGSPAACTCLAPRGDEWIATGGEDGQIVIVALEQRQPVQTLADSCTINDLTFLKQSEILSVNSFGQLKTFDLRQDPKQQAQIFSVTENHTPLLCLDKHPGQAHIVATGGEDGMLTIWDLRQEKFPMTLLEAHTGAMWEVKFHPHNPNHLFTCSDDGSLWHWDGSSTDPVSSFTGTKGKDSTRQGGAIVSPWLSLETSRHKLDISSLLPNKSLPVNSLDIDTSTLLCGTDSETIYSVHLPMLD